MKQLQTASEARKLLLFIRFTKLNLCRDALNPFQRGKHREVDAFHATVQCGFAPIDQDMSSRTGGNHAFPKLAQGAPTPLMSLDPQELWGQA